MAEQDQIINLKYTTGNAQKEIAAVNRFLKEQGLTLKDLNKVVINTNEAYKKLSAVVTATTNEGVEVTRKYLNLKNGIRGVQTVLRSTTQDMSLASKGMREMIDASQRLYRAQEKLKEQAQRNQAGQAIAEAVTGGPSAHQRAGFAPTADEIAKVSKAKNAIVDLFARGGAKAKDFERIWNEVQQGIFKGYGGIEARIQQTIVRLTQANNNLGKSAASAVSRTLADPAKQLAKTNALADKFAVKMQKIFSDMDRLNKKQDASVKSMADRFASKMNKIFSDMAAAEQKQKDKTLSLADRFANKMNKIFSDMAAAEQKQADKTRMLADRFGNRMQRIMQEAARLQHGQTRAGQLNTLITERLGGFNPGADAQTRAAYNNAINNLTKFVAQGRISAANLLQIFRNVQNGVQQNLSGVGLSAARASQQVLTAFNKMNSQGGGLLQRIGQHLRTTSQSFSSFTLNAKSIIRIGEIQVLHTIMFRLLAAFQSAIVKAREFSIQIAEIRTISQQAQLSTKQWTDSVLKLSSAFGQSASDVAEGLYETLSNQVGKGAQSFLFLEQALRFATIAVTDTKTSVNLLTSVLNSFQIDASRTKEVSDILFKTIDLGRVRAQDMANTFGRVGVVAKGIGIDFKELSASIAELTIKGVAFDDVQTQLINVISKLSKPTEAMKNILKSWGVESGKAAIAAYGFFGVLRKLEQEAAKGGDSFAELNKIFQDIRAIRGATGLIGTSALDGLESKLNEITNSAKQADEAFNIVMENSGKRLEIEFQKISNYFLQMGQQFNDTLLKLGDGFGGLAKFVQYFLQNLKQLVTFWPQILGALGLYESLIIAARVQTLYLTIATKGWTAALMANPVGLVLGVIGTLAVTIALLSDSMEEQQQKLQDMMDRTEDNALKVHQRLIDELTKQANALTDQNIKDIDKVFGGVLRWTASIRASNNSVIDSLKAVSEQANANLKKSFSEAKDSIKASMNEIKDSVKEAEKVIDDLKKHQQDRKFSNIGKAFDRSIAFDDDPTKRQKTLQFIQQLNTAGKAAFNQGNVELAKKFFDKIDELSQKMYDEDLQHHKQVLANKQKMDEAAIKAREAHLKSAFLAKNGQASRGSALNDQIAYTRAQQEAARAQQAVADSLKLEQADQQLLLQLEQERLAVEQQEIANRQAEKAANEAKLKQQEAEFANLTKLISSADTFDKVFKGVDPAKQKAAFDDLANKILLTAKNAGISKEAQLNLFRDLNNKSQLIELNTINDLREQELAKITAITTKQKEYAESIANTRQALNKSVAERGKAIIDIKKVLAGAAQEAGDLKSSLKGSENGQPVLKKANELLQLRNQITAELNKASNGGVVDADKLTKDVRKLQTLLAAFKAEVDHASKFGGSGGTNLNDLQLGNEKLPAVFEKLSQAAKTIKSSQAAFAQQRADLTAQEQALAAIAGLLNEIPPQYQVVAKASSETVPKTNDEWKALVATLGQSIQNLKTLETQTQTIRNNAAATINSIQAAGAGAPIPGHQIGGIIGHFSRGGIIPQYFAAGGYPKRLGTDSQLAMLTPGEAVLDAKTTRTYQPLIRALQTMRFENFASAGNQTTIGDVHININSNGNDVDARKLGNRLRREIKKGNLILS